jgi:H+/Cl- antiporter ClcA
MASLFFNTQENSIRELFHDPLPYDTSSLIFFFVVYYFLAMITFGLALPSGLFVPSMVIGK